MLTSHVFNAYTNPSLRSTPTTRYRAFTSTNFIIYFLSNELFYTNLKYSRVPQFDTSSGAAASFTSGLFGFMVCESFGFELIDSGDFLFAVLYAVAVIFIGALFISISGATNNWSSYLLNLVSSFRNS